MCNTPYISLRNVFIMQSLPQNCQERRYPEILLPLPIQMEEIGEEETMILQKQESTPTNTVPAAKGRPFNVILHAQ
jgi:hypothetical protein